MNRRLPAQASAQADHQHPRVAAGSVNTIGIEDDAVTLAKINNDVYATTVTTIDPDDVAAAGTVGGVLSPGDHQHAITTGAPAALTKTATPAESSGTGFARDAHVHATSALPWGIVDRDIFTSNSAAFSSTNTTDFSLTLTADATRLYKVCLSTEVDASVDSRWVIQVFAGGTQVGEVYREQVLTGGVIGYCNGHLLWLPSSGSITVECRVLNTAGGGTLTFPGSGTIPRQFWIEDIGPR